MLNKIGNGIVSITNSKVPITMANDCNCSLENKTELSTRGSVIILICFPSSLINVLLKSLKSLKLLKSSMLTLKSLNLLKSLKSL
jgi:hypothetical protein